MGKQPAFQFYPGDWIQDTRALSLAAKGAWIDLLCAMWRSQNRGTVTLTIVGYGRLIGADVEQTQRVIKELTDMQICDHVTNCNGDVTIINRRMAREEKERISTNLRVKRFRNGKFKRSCNENETPLSSSSTSSSVHKGENYRPPLPEKINPETWDAYLEMRKQIKKPASVRAKELIISKLLKMNGDLNAILEQSIMNSWQGVFPLKADYGGVNGNGKQLQKQKPKLSEIPDPDKEWEIITRRREQEATTGG